MHCINICITKKENLIENADYCELKQGFVAVYDNQIKPNSDYADVSTDYFGGCGEQFATLHKGGKVVELPKINDALKELGVIKEDHDEFDAINLGWYRTNEDFFEKEETNYDEESDDGFDFQI